MSRLRRMFGLLTLSTLAVHCIDQTQRVNEAGSSGTSPRVTPPTFDLLNARAARRVNGRILMSYDEHSMVRIRVDRSLSNDAQVMLSDASGQWPAKLERQVVEGHTLMFTSTDRIPVPGPGDVKISIKGRVLFSQAIEWRIAPDELPTTKRLADPGLTEPKNARAVAEPALQSKDWWIRTWAWFELARWYLRHGHLDATKSAYESAGREAADAGELLIEVRATFSRSFAAYRQGLLDEADAFAQ